MSEREIMGEEEWDRQKNLEKKIITRKDGPKKIIAPWILDFIKNHALSSPKEIYGWLIGRENPEGDLIVLTAVACQRYQLQTYIGAAPDPREVQELSSSLPHGVGMIGIYHSHPADIFHSSVDDRTLQNLARYYPKMISAVTNSNSSEDDEQNKTRWFQLSSEEKSTNEIEMTEEISPIEHFNSINTYCHLSIDLMLPISGMINQVLLKHLMGNFEHIWSNGQFSFLIESTKKRKRYVDHQSKRGIPPLETSKELFENEVIKLKSSHSLGNLPQNTLKRMFKKKSSIFIDLSCSNTNISKKMSSNKEIQLQGDIYFSFHQILNSQKAEIQEDMIAKIKAEVMDLMIQSVSRCIFEGKTPRNLKIIAPVPIQLPYPGLSMMLNVMNRHIPSFIDKINAFKNTLDGLSPLAAEYFPNHDQIFQQDDNIMQSMFKRAKYLIFSGKAIESCEILYVLQDIYNIRGNFEKRDEVSQIIQMIQQ
ncbi:Mov34/MPN/PAD-1 family protein [Candidatus Lokiarchaeum ossiferum]|uniref:Mov34/MPN/PAD-1 family protein n=1 Tax=Candidatus Lokiarchaeum ossiferum TaxID=2951803 RepID=UPI00352D8E95